MKSIRCLGILFWGIIGTGFAFSASAATSFSVNVIEGQGALNNVFYHGRCVRADIMLDTDGRLAGGADLAMHYDSSRIAIRQNDCVTPATTIYPEHQFGNYVNNHVSSSTITLGAYNGPGVAYNGSSRFASFYFVVLDGAGEYAPTIDFLFGDTTDTNLAEYGSGNDILEEVHDFEMDFSDDADSPYVSNQQPTENQAAVPVNSDIRLRINDDGAGVDIDTMEIVLQGAQWGVVYYDANNSAVNYSCHTTNANRVDYCDVAINPSRNFYYCEDYTVQVSVTDLGNPIAHTLSQYTYSFQAEEDVDAPAIYNRSPNQGENGVAKDAPIIFDMYDIASMGGYSGTGIDLATLQVLVSAPGWGANTYTVLDSELIATPRTVNDYGNVYDYNIEIRPAVPFPENTSVTVQVLVRDRGCAQANILDDTFAFVTADTLAPKCSLFSPDQHSVSVGINDDMTMHCTDSGSGVDINALRIVVNGIVYGSSGINTFSYSGSPLDYFVVINPRDDFPLRYAWEVIINISDLAGNPGEQVSYGLATDTDETCEKCEECEECEKKEDETTCTTIVQKNPFDKSESCDALKKVAGDSDVATLLQAESGNSYGQLQEIALNTINDVSVKNEATTVTVNDDRVIFEGWAFPKSRVTLLINSNPIIVTGLANDKGAWRIEMANIFPNGEHKVSAVSLSDDQYIVHTKQLAQFEVKRFFGCSFPWWLLLLAGIFFSGMLFWFYKYKKMANECQKNNKQAR